VAPSRPPLAFSQELTPNFIPKHFSGLPHKAGGANAQGAPKAPPAIDRASPQQVAPSRPPLAFSQELTPNFIPKHFSGLPHKAGGANAQGAPKAPPAIDRASPQQVAPSRPPLAFSQELTPNFIPKHFSGLPHKAGGANAQGAPKAPPAIDRASPQQVAPSRPPLAFSQELTPNFIPKHFSGLPHKAGGANAQGAPKAPPAIDRASPQQVAPSRPPLAFSQELTPNFIPKHFSGLPHKAGGANAQGAPKAPPAIDRASPQQVAPSRPPLAFSQELTPNFIPKHFSGLPHKAGGANAQGAPKAPPAIDRASPQQVAPSRPPLAFSQELTPNFIPKHFSGLPHKAGGANAQGAPKAPPAIDRASPQQVAPSRPPLAFSQELTPNFIPKHFSGLPHKAGGANAQGAPKAPPAIDRASPQQVAPSRPPLAFSQELTPNFIPKHFSGLPHKAGGANAQGAPKAPPAIDRASPQQVAPSRPPLAFSQELTPNFIPKHFSGLPHKAGGANAQGAPKAPPAIDRASPQQVAPSRPPLAFSQELTPNFIPKHFSGLPHKAGGANAQGAPKAPPAIDRASPQQVAPSRPPLAFSQELTPNFIPKHFSGLPHKAGGAPKAPPAIDRASPASGAFRAASCFLSPPNPNHVDLTKIPNLSTKNLLGLSLGA
jgi:arginase family enzyme